MNKKISVKKKLLYSLILLVIVFVAAFFVYAAIARINVDRFTYIRLEDMKKERDYINLRGVDIHYEQYGKDQGKNILLVHGFAGSTLSYQNNVKALAQENTVYAIDLKGYGFSQKDIDGSYTLEEQSWIVSEFIEEKNLDPVIAVGHSMGSTVVLLSYDREPEKFEKLVLIASAGLSSSPNVLSRFISQAILDIIYFNFIVNENNFIDSLSSAFYDDAFVDSQVIANYKTPFRIENANKAFLRIVRDADDYGIRPILEKISIPTLIIWGREDGWIDVENAYLFHEIIDGSTLNIIDKAGHLPMEEQPEEANRIILDFIRLGK
jgi:pimeloyl-ACP methyl ester carboxylesterase